MLFRMLVVRRLLERLASDHRVLPFLPCAAIRLAKEQKSISLEKRAEGTYAEYRRQKANASGGPLALFVTILLAPGMGHFH